MLDSPCWPAPPQRNRSAALHRPPHCIKILIGETPGIAPLQILLNEANRVRGFGAYDADEDATGREKNAVVLTRE